MSENDLEKNLIVELRLLSIKWRTQLDSVDKYLSTSSTYTTHERQSSELAEIIFLSEKLMRALEKRNFNI